MSRSELIDPLSRARALVKRRGRGYMPRPSTIVEVFEGCKSWDEVIAVAEILAEALPVSVRGNMVAVRVGVKRRGNDIAVTKVVARRDDDGIKVRVVSYYA